MKIIEPSATLLDDINATDIYNKIERCGRVCYQSFQNRKQYGKTPEDFVRMLIKREHESVLEHVSLTFHIICDRAIQNELVRHRHASFCVTGDTVIPSYSSTPHCSGKKRTIEEIYNWSQDARCQAAFKALVIRSFDEETHTIVPNKIRAVFFNGVQDVFEVKTESGRTIKCTKGHRFFTTSGWKCLRDIDIGDSIYSNGAIGAFADKVIEIVYAGKEKVYDLEMESPYHNYVANGIVVHNSVESTRYVKYNELALVEPIPAIDFIRATEQFYQQLTEDGIKPETARSILPLCTKSELYMTANLREWRYILKLRTSKYAHPQMRFIMNQILAAFKEKLPVIVEDINYDAPAAN